VSRAIHASDEMATLVVDRQGRLRRVWAEVAGLSARTSRAAFRAAVLAAAAADQVRVLTQAERALAPIDDQEGIPRLARTARTDGLAMLERLDVVQAGLRDARVTIVGMSVPLQERRATARRDIGDVHRVLEGLYAEMYAAEAVVADLMPQWPSLFDGMEAPALSGDGPLYVCPVDPPRSYSDDFGAPRYTGGYHPHAGIDIFAPAGTPVRAPFDGIAVDASNAIGGYAVRVHGGEGYVYNAHLSAFGTLGQVEAGTVIGFVGNTGNAATTPAHDHFEWHPDGGLAVNPFPYLNEVCRP
jgi:murein DD-endopeptidase MepM/ murein hydrolase activator NlpD